MKLKMFFTIVFITSTTITMGHENDKNITQDEDTAWWTPYALVTGLIASVYYVNHIRAHNKRINALLNTPNEELPANTLVEKIKHLYENYNISPAFDHVQALYAKGGAQAMHTIKETIKPEDRSALFNLGFYNYDPEMATITIDGVSNKTYLENLLNDLEHHEISPEKKANIFKIIDKWVCFTNKDGFYFPIELYRQIPTKITSFSNFKKITSLLSLDLRDVSPIRAQNCANFSLYMTFLSFTNTVPFIWLDYVLNHGATHRQLDQRHGNYDSPVDYYFKTLQLLRKPDHFKPISYMREVYGLLRYHYNKNSLLESTAWEKENGVINAPITLFNGYDYAFDPSSLTIASLGYNSDKKTEKPLFPPDLRIVTT